MGLVNAVVPHEELDAEVDRWCAEILERSPTAIAIAKRSFNADSENIRGIAAMGMQALELYYADRGIQGRRPCLQGKAQARFPPLQEIRGRSIVKTRCARSSRDPDPLKTSSRHSGARALVSRARARAAVTRRASGTGRIDRSLVREMGALGLIGAELPEASRRPRPAGVTAGLDHRGARLRRLQRRLRAAARLAERPDHRPACRAANWPANGCPRIVAGERRSFSLGLTEPRGGSDAANLALSARPRWRCLRAQRREILDQHGRSGRCHGGLRPHRPVEHGARGVSAFLVPMDTPGRHAPRRFDDLGSHTIGRGSIFFDNVAVPAANRLGAEGRASRR